MTSRLLGAVALVAVCATVPRADAHGAASAVAPQVAATPIAVEPIRQRLAGCFRAWGADDAIPKAAWPAGAGWIVHPLRPPGGGLVSDGHGYLLLSEPGTRAVFVVQSGGLAGAQVVFGPMPLDAAGLPSVACATGAGG